MVNLKVFVLLIEGHLLNSASFVSVAVDVKQSGYVRWDAVEVRLLKELVAILVRVLHWNLLLELVSQRLVLVALLHQVLGLFTDLNLLVLVLEVVVVERLGR